MTMPISKLDSSKEHFKAALNHHDSILIILDRFQLDIPYDDNERFPEDWTEDPLLLLGQYLEILELSEAEMTEELQRPLSTVKWWLRSAKKRLRQVLHPFEGSQEPIRPAPEKKVPKE